MYTLAYMGTLQSLYPVSLTTFMGEWRTTVFKHRAQQRTFNSSEIALIVMFFHLHIQHSRLALTTCRKNFEQTKESEVSNSHLLKCVPVDNSSQLYIKKNIIPICEAKHQTVSSCVYLYINCSPLGNPYLNVIHNYDETH